MIDHEGKQVELTSLSSVLLSKDYRLFKVYTLDFKGLVD